MRDWILKVFPVFQVHHLTARKGYFALRSDYLENEVLLIVVVAIIVQKNFAALRLFAQINMKVAIFILLHQSREGSCSKILSAVTPIRPP